MKPPRLLTILCAALFSGAPPQSSLAADVVVDISSFAPREPNVVLRQIELNVAIKQYEKVLMESHEARMQYEIGPTETGLSDVQQKEWMHRAARKLKYLEVTADDLRKRIATCVAEANEMAREVENEKAGAKAKPKADMSQPKKEPRT